MWSLICLWLPPSSPSQVFRSRPFSCRTDQCSSCWSSSGACQGRVWVRTKPNQEIWRHLLHHKVPTWGIILQTSLRTPSKVCHHQSGPPHLRRPSWLEYLYQWHRKHKVSWIPQGDQLWSFLHQWRISWVLTRMGAHWWVDRSACCASFYQWRFNLR